MPGNPEFQELDPPENYQLSLEMGTRPFSGSTFVQFSGRVLVVMSNVLKIHSLPLQALAERLDHFDRVADVALGDLYTMWAAGNCREITDAYIYTYFFCSKLLFYVVIIHPLAEVYVGSSISKWSSCSTDLNGN